MKIALHRCCIGLSIYLLFSSVCWFGLKLLSPAAAAIVAGSNSMDAMITADAYAIAFLLIGFGLGWLCFRRDYPGQSLWRYTVNFWKIGH